MKLFHIFNKKSKNTSFVCECCGTSYDKMPLCFGSDYPDYYFSVPPNERDKRIEITDSLCVVDKEHFFHRGELIIPIIDFEENLIFNVWTSISRENFELRMDLWEVENRVSQKPYFGWMQTFVPTYGDTLNIKSKVIENNPGFIPSVVITEENHKLTIDQKNGISLQSAKEIVKFILEKNHLKNKK